MKEITSVIRIKLKEEYLEKDLSLIEKKNKKSEGKMEKQLRIRPFPRVDDHFFSFSLSFSDICGKGEHLREIRGISDWVFFRAYGILWDFPHVDDLGRSMI